MGERRPPTTRLYTVRQCHSSAHERASQRQARVPISVQRVERRDTKTRSSCVGKGRADLPSGGATISVLAPLRIN